MTVISDNIHDVAGVDDSTVFVFSVPFLRESEDGTAVVTMRHVRLTADGDGALETPDLDPGAASVRVGVLTYRIEIPDSVTPVRLWPLIEAGLPATGNTASFVHNGGGVAMIRTMSAADYAELTSATTPDPGSTFLVY